MDDLIPLSHFTEWLASGERGVSSNAIVSRLTGTQVGRAWSGNHPHDPDDFRRCQLLLNAHPLAVVEFHAMRSVSPQWARLVDSWDEIHTTIESEVPGYLDGASGGRARLAYHLMRQTIHGVEATDG